MESKILYQRDGILKATTIESRRLPNLLAVKFVIIEKELSESGADAPQDEPLHIETLFSQMNLRILEVIPDGTVVQPKRTLEK